MQKYMDFINKTVPKVLTQVDRDRHSPTYGCCDRNFWHLKIRDFSSAILQQTGLSIALLTTVPYPGNVFYGREDVKDWARASVYYWEKIQLKDGSFNEYYPFEHGFPPTAFSLYSSCETYKRLNMDEPKLTEAFSRTGKYLASHRETEAYNQEMASITALYSLYTITKENWVLSAVNRKLLLLLEVQSEDGFFPEYGGADIGYLSVFFDMMAEYYWMSRDERVLKPLEKILSFLLFFIHPDRTAGGEYGSRNTTYFLPNGLEVMRQLGYPEAEAARDWLFEDADKTGFFMDSVDDRYCSHYLLHSFLRALEKEIQGGATCTEKVVLPFHAGKSTYFSDAGFWSHSEWIERGIPVYMIVGARKGGVLKLYGKGEQVFADFGYRVNYGKGKIAVTNWQDPSYIVKQKGNSLTVSGHFNLVTLKVGSPFLHLGLRAVAFVAGNKIIRFLKKKIILVDKHTDIAFRRKITFQDGVLQIEDEIESPKPVCLEGADSPSVRHVASGKFFSISDLCFHDCKSYGNSKKFYIKKKYDCQSGRFIENEELK
ncbi:hypothetical protein KE531_09600 [Eubacteriaceae bacterium Marseille-Q4139]|nr:hypothetical protein [Eubacteriaceae bacterium Marseille-Q4139]